MGLQVPAPQLQAPPASKEPLPLLISCHDPYLGEENKTTSHCSPPKGVSGVPPTGFILGQGENICCFPRPLEM